MKKLFFSFLLIACTVSLSAQEKVWLNKKGECLPDSIQATNYITIIQEAENDIKVTFFNLAGEKVNETHYLTYSQARTERIKEGKCTYFYSNGQPKELLYYKNNRREGEGIEFYPDGNIHVRKNYLHGRLEGMLLEYYPNSTIKREEMYKNGKCTMGKLFAEDGSKLKHKTAYEQFPQYSDGGIAEFMADLKKATKYPKELQKREFDGKVLLNFTVDPEGRMIDPKIKGNVHPELEKAILQAFYTVAGINKWEPGIQKGEAKKVQFTVPISFRSH